MFIEDQQLMTIDRKELPSKAAELKKEGYRLVQVCGLASGKFEVTYSFDKEYRLLNVRILLDNNDLIIPSITGSFLAAFTYENELQDLFGLKVEGLAVDFKGKFYRSAAKSPFQPKPGTPGGA